MLFCVVLFCVVCAVRLLLEFWGARAFDTEQTHASLSQFMEWARAVCAALAARGCWADYIDPCSGLPVRLCVVDVGCFGGGLGGGAVGGVCFALSSS